MRWKSPSLEMGLEAEKREKAKVREAEAENEREGQGEKEGEQGYKGKEDQIIGSEEEKDIQTFGPGWRVEFRPLEIQLTDFENAAFSLLTVLTTRSLLAMGYNFYLPLSLMEENMRRAQLENAVMTQKFWVRKESFSPSLTTVPLSPLPLPPLPLPLSSSSGRVASVSSPINNFGTIRRTADTLTTSLVPKLSEITAIELTLDEFFNGKTGTAIDRAAGRQGEGFPGLIPAIYGYLEALGCDALMIGRLRPYLTLLQKRASGELPTAAQWIRKFVRSHFEYKGKKDIVFDTLPPLFYSPSPSLLSFFFLLLLLLLRFILFSFSILLYYPFISSLFSFTLLSYSILSYPPIRTLPYPFLSFPMILPLLSFSPIPFFYFLSFYSILSFPHLFFSFSILSYPYPILSFNVILLSFPFLSSLLHPPLLSSFIHFFPFLSPPFLSSRLTDETKFEQSICTHRFDKRRK